MANNHFGAIGTTIWHSRRFREMKEPDAKLVYMYLHTNEHRNAAGCFKVRIGYMAYDMDMPLERVSNGIRMACEVGLVEYDEKHEIALINDFFRFNKIGTVNHAKGVKNCLDALPDCEITRKSKLFFNEHIADKPFKSEAYNGIIMASECHSKGIGKASECHADTLRHNTLDIDNSSVFTTETLPEKESPTLPCVVSQNDKPDIKQAFEAYNTAAPKHGWPIAVKLNKQRETKLRHRLKDAGGFEGWIKAIDRAGRSDFLTGRSANDRNWRPDIDFFLQESSFLKLIEGTYDNKGHASSRVAGGYQG